MFTLIMILWLNGEPHTAIYPTVFTTKEACEQQYIEEADGLKQRQPNTPFIHQCVDWGEPA